MPAKVKEVKAEKKFDSKSALSALLVDTKDDHYAFVDKKAQVISTGSLLLDSIVRVRSGDIIRLCAKGAESGKTSQSFVFAHNFHNTMPKSKTIYVMSEARLSPEMQSRSGHKFVFNPDDWEYGTVFVFPCNIFETIAKVLETLLPQMYEVGEHLCIIWDSLDGAILKADLQKEVWDGKESPKVAGVPLLTKLLFKRFALPLNYYNGLMIVISQYTTEIKLDPYSKEPPRQNSASGGSSINHMSSYTLTYLPRYKGDMILEKPNENPDIFKNKVLGLYATIEITKSGTDVTGTKIKVPIKKGVVGPAIWREKEVVDMAMSYEMLKRSGAWYKFTDDIIQLAANDGITLKDSIQGEVGVFEYFTANQDVLDWFYRKIQSFLSCATEERIEEIAAGQESENS